MKKLITQLLSGLNKPKVDRQIGPNEMQHGLFRMSKLVDIHTFIEVGKTHENWAEKAAEIFPFSDFLLIENEATHLGILEEKCLKHSNFEFFIGILGDQDNKLILKEEESTNINSIENKINKNQSKYEKLDSLLSRLNKRGPFCIKLDIQGFEIPVLEGATQTLSLTDLLLIKAYNFEPNERSLRFTQISEYLELKGFRCVDLVNFERRSKDQLLDSMYLFFLRESHPSIQKKTLNTPKELTIL